MRKNSRLLIAYTMLFASSVAVVCHDSHVRSLRVPGLSEAEKKAAGRRAKGEIASRTVMIPTAPAEYIDEVKPPAETASTAPVASTAPQLPRGIFLTKATMKLTATDGSSRELPAGTHVMLVRRDNGKMKIHCDGLDYLVDEEKVTRNTQAVEKLLASRKG